MFRLTCARCCFRSRDQWCGATAYSPPQDVCYIPPGRSITEQDVSASITASATFGHSASPDNVTCWYIMALPCALKIYVKYFDKFLSPEPIAFQSLTKVLLFQ